MVTLFILIVATIKIKGACEGLLYQTSDTLISVKKICFNIVYYIHRYKHIWIHIHIFVTYLSGQQYVSKVFIHVKMI